MDIKEILEIVFIPDWGTHAYICKDGDIWIQLQLGKCFNREKFINDPFSEFGNNDWFALRINLFDKLDEYYKTKYKK